MLERGPGVEVGRGLRVLRVGVSNPTARRADSGGVNSHRTPLRRAPHPHTQSFLQPRRETLGLHAAPQPPPASSGLCSEEGVRRGDERARGTSLGPAIQRLPPPASEQPSGSCTLPETMWSELYASGPREVRGSLAHVDPPTWPGQKGWEDQLQVRWPLSDSLMPQKCL